MIADTGDRCDKIISGSKRHALLFRRLKRYRVLYLLMLPGIAYLIVNNYLPMAGMAIAFKSVNFSIAALDNVKSQYMGSIVTGSLDPEQLIAEFVSKLKEAGIDKVIAEKQSQLDTWAKANGK